VQKVAGAGIGPDRGAVVALSSVLFGSEAQAQRSIQIAQAKRTATVTVYVGKSEDVRTESSFVELTVGDPRSPTSTR